jgi:hypothetical protein
MQQTGLSRDELLDGLSRELTEKVNQITRIGRDSLTKTQRKGVLLLQRLDEGAGKCHLLRVIPTIHRQHP